MYNCFDIAKELLKFAKEDAVHMGTMKLLKLTYISHGYYLGFKGKPLFSNEVQAWKYGPVIPELYHVTKRFGSRSVDLEIVNLYSENNLNETDKKFLKIIWNNYKKYNGLQLSSKTHEKNTPWDLVYNKVHYKTIDNSVIEEYYKKIISDRKQHAA
ncbi:hypothetical protein A8C32_05950 [Flavivirga aquatica]|uniref:Antitoxin SocA-like Panacea domain-containing protein n=1 Tax=Flavivirga aquatica TaxID=1849968 RepID=A0A1E5SHZ7_9FLAO|nr:type II toxin-antitoxin system antitoxin SocA domain-containing protein [Flavivirga aquatica]OEJ98738.1 hypothetical protein A8C32_05950 [Flavivirga aquatica]